MRSNFAFVVLASCSCWLLVACTPATPPAQEPASTLAGGPSTDAPDSSSGSGGSGGLGATDAAPNGGTPSGTAQAGSAGNVQPRMCGGIAGIQCPDKQYCAFAPEARCGAGDMSGTCAKIPEACIQLVDQVCGCNDKTYSNACMAAQAGVSVISKGPCAAPATTPEGGLCGTRGASLDCGPGLYCAYKADCGATDRGGVCSKKPTMCTKIYKPVCGCDGKTYGNACTAAAEGISVVKDGPCKQ